MHMVNERANKQVMADLTGNIGEVIGLLKGGGILYSGDTYLHLWAMGALVSSLFTIWRCILIWAVEDICGI